MKTKKKLFRRRKKIIKPREQLKLALFVVLFLLIYSLAFGITIFYPLAAELRGSANLEDQARIASVVLDLHEVIWPALGAILALAFVGTILFSHRVVGPVYRLEQTVDMFMEGNFTERMRLRKTDELKEIETVINRLAEYLENVKAMDVRLHADLRKKLLIINALLRAEGLSQESKASKIVDALIASLESQPDAFSACQNESSSTCTMDTGVEKYS